MNRVASSTARTDAPSWHELVEDATIALGSPAEARWISEEFTKKAAFTRRDPEVKKPDATTRREFLRLVERRLAGEPLQHVLGHWSFRTIDLLVDRRALVPRPETEVVVGHALAELERVPGTPIVVDLGTGSGAIACSIASEHARARVIAVEISAGAAELAMSNRDRMVSDVARRIDVRVGDWFEALPREVVGRVDLVVSNPPYVSEGEWRLLDPVVRDFDPKRALVAGPVGIEAIDSLISGSPAVIADGGAVVVEIAPSQSGAARALAHMSGARSVKVHPDLAGRDRVLVARW